GPPSLSRAPTMRALLASGLALVLIVGSARADDGKKKEGPPSAPMVYFTLKDNSADAKTKLVAARKKHLDKHDGTVYFSAGVLGDDFKRAANDRDWDVALHLVFKDKAAHDKYQDHARHKKFIDENKDNWKKVRVFDAERS